MLENMRSAFRGIWSHKLRSFLTMLGVIIGIAAIIAIVSTIKGTNEQIKENLLGAGNNNVKITLKQGGADFYYGWETPEGVVEAPEEMRESIRSLPHVADATFYHTRSYENGIRSGSNMLESPSVYGIDTHYLATCGYEVYSGRPFAQKDFDRIHKAAIIDSSAAEILFPDGGAVGSVLEIKGEPFTIIGLYRRADDYHPIINNLMDYGMYNREEYGTILIPDVTWPVVYSFDEPVTCAARADKTENMSTIGKSIEEVMADCITGTGGDFSYKADDLLEQARNQQELASSTNRMMALVASIALLVGGIGVMNIMLVSVTERTPEIGLKKALGARRRRILSQFLTEAILLTGIGGVLGVGSGIVLAYVISHFAGTPVAISLPSVFAGVGLSMVIGIVFGLFPAVQASKLNPIDALRRE